MANDAISPAGSCVAGMVGADDLRPMALYRLPERSRVATSKPMSEPATAHLADDCSAVVLEVDRDPPCVETFGEGFRPLRQICLDGGIADVALSGDGKRLVLGAAKRDGPDAGLHVFDVARGERVAHIAPKDGEYFTKVVISDDGARVAYAVADRVRVTTLGAKDALATLVVAVPPRRYVRALQLSPKGARLALDLTGEGGSFVLAMVDLVEARPLFMHAGLPASSALGFSRDGTRAVVRTAWGMRVIDTGSGADLAQQARLFGIDGAAVSASGERVVISAPGHLSIWDPRDCSRLAVLPNAPSLSGLVLPDATSVLGSTGQEMVRVDLQSGARSVIALGEPKSAAIERCPSTGAPRKVIAIALGAVPFVSSTSASLARATSNRASKPIRSTTRAGPSSRRKPSSVSISAIRMSRSSGRIGRSRPKRSTLDAQQLDHRAILLESTSTNPFQAPRRVCDQIEDQ